MNARRTILLFARSPEAEARAKRLPLAAGSALVAGFLQSWRRRAAEVGAELVVATPSASLGRMRRLFPDCVVTPQSGGSFGERIEKAFQYAFAQAAASVLMVGGDGAPLDAAEIGQHFAHLESDPRSMTLAPAADGGVNSIGFGVQAERELHGVAWGTSRVDDQLRSVAARLGLTLLVTSVGHDLDSPANLKSLYRVSLHAAAWRLFRHLLKVALLRSGAAAGRILRPLDAMFAGPSPTRGPPL